MHIPDFTIDGPALTLVRTAPRTLTGREVAVVTLVAEGLSNRQIGGELGISDRTVQTHVASAMQKLSATTRTMLATTAIREKIVPLYPARPLRPVAR